MEKKNIILQNTVKPKIQDKKYPRQKILIFLATRNKCEFFVSNLETYIFFCSTIRKDSYLFFLLQTKEILSLDFCPRKVKFYLQLFFCFCKKTYLFCIKKIVLFFLCLPKNIFFCHLENATFLYDLEKLIFFYDLKQTSYLFVFIYIRSPEKDIYYSRNHIKISETFIFLISQPVTS